MLAAAAGEAPKQAAPPTSLTVDIKALASSGRYVRPPRSLQDGAAAGDVLSVTAERLANAPSHINLQSYLQDKNSAGLQPTVYEYGFWSAPGQEYTITPRINVGQPGALLFYPRSRDVTIATADCPPPLESFTGRTGLYLTGAVTPGVAGVNILVTSTAQSGAVNTITVQTQADGSYSAGMQVSLCLSSVFWFPLSYHPLFTLLFFRTFV